jgi:hypothetical protein
MRSGLASLVEATHLRPTLRDERVRQIPGKATRRCQSRKYRRIQSHELRHSDRFVCGLDHQICRSDLCPIMQYYRT